MYWERTTELPKIASCQDILLVYGTSRPEDIQLMSRILTPEELMLCGKLRHEPQKNTWISCHVALRKMLADFMVMDPRDIDIRKNKFGKPYLQDSDLFFNISHTNSAFLLAFNQGGKLGVDLEILSGDEDLPSLIDYAFSNDETEYCMNGGDISARFLEIWTLKEAFLKYSGIGLTDYLRSINIFGTEQNELRSLNLNFSTVTCPNNETCSIVFSNIKSLNCNWLC